MENKYNGAFLLKNKVSRVTQPQKQENSVVSISVSKIVANSAQPRTDFDIDSIVSLADSIRRYGILQPITVRKISKKPADYELIAGERRLRAAKMLGLKHVPCIVMEVEDSVSAELALVENLLRQNLGIFEQANAFLGLMEKYSLTQEEIASRFSMSQPAVANKLRLLKLSKTEQEMISKAQLTERHARALLKIQDEETRISVIDRIIYEKMNVNDTEEYIDSLISAKEKVAPRKPRPAQTYGELCTSFGKYLKKLSSDERVSVIESEDDNCTKITVLISK